MLIAIFLSALFSRTPYLLDCLQTIIRNGIAFALSAVDATVFWFLRRFFLWGFGGAGTYFILYINIAQKITTVQKPIKLLNRPTKIPIKFNKCVQ
jgi:hypothetical protein